MEESEILLALLAEFNSGNDKIGQAGAFGAGESLRFVSRFA
jgi:hypothetical protein